ncbi:MAG: acyltransferase [Pseudomonadota bacterium]
MAKNISLRAYVKRRNGVPLGASGALQKMLNRSLGAGSFSLFWRYWNPIWSYYLSKFVMRPAGTVLPTFLAVILTFVVSGAVHDLAVTLISREITFIITPWFLVIGLVVVLTDLLRLQYHTMAWPVRAVINTSLIVGSYYLSKQMIF